MYIKEPTDICNKDICPTCKDKCKYYWKDVDFWDIVEIDDVTVRCGHSGWRKIDRYNPNRIVIEGYFV